MVQRSFARCLLCCLLCLQAASLFASEQKPRLSDLAVLEDKSGTENIHSIALARLLGSELRYLDEAEAVVCQLRV